MEITASFEELLKQASMTAEDYMRKAVTAIDQLMGDGYAEKNPSLIIAFMQIADNDYRHSATMKMKYSI